MSEDINQLYFPSTLNLVETLKAKMIPEHPDINSVLLEQIKERIGDKCIQTGHIQKSSIKILERTIGKINSGHFNGYIHYNVKISFNLCIPVVGQKISAKVFGKNQAGILCLAGPFHIMLSPENQDDTEIYQNIEKGDEILINVLRYKIMLNHDHIRVLGKFISKIR